MKNGKYYIFMNQIILKIAGENDTRLIAAGLGAMAGGLVMDVLPCAALCTAMVVADTFSAIRLSRRLRRCADKNDAADFKRVTPNPELGKVSSRRLRKAGGSLLLMYFFLTVAALAHQVLGTVGGFNPLNAYTMGVCLWEGLSILENEASCNGSRWAEYARRWLVDKASRHIS